jgi:hypothetical protein
MHFKLLYKHLHRCFLEGASGAVFDELVDDRGIDHKRRARFLLFEPWVCESFLKGDALAW